MSLNRPLVGALVVPYVVDATRTPVDFKALDPDHVERCATQRRCGVCGDRIKRGPMAFVGPDDGRSCYADPWMHPKCAAIAKQQCPFLAGRLSWRDPSGVDQARLAPYVRMVTRLAPDGRAHRDQLGAWHFEATG